MERTPSLVPVYGSNLPWWSRLPWIQLPVDAIRDSNGDGIGDLPGLTAELPFFDWSENGVILIPPFYPSGGQDRGYDIVNHRAVDPVYGTLDDFRLLVKTAHVLGLKVVIDIVVCHTSDQAPEFKSSCTRPTGPHGDWYQWDKEGRRYVSYRDANGHKHVLDNLLEGDPAPRHVLDAEGDLVPALRWTHNSRREEYYYHVFKRGQPALNYGSAEQPNWPVWHWMRDTFLFWAELGVDGFRVDAAPFQFQREGTSCEGLEDVHVFTRWTSDELERAGHYDRLLLCESDRPDLEKYIRPGEFQAGYDFEARTRLWRSMAARSNGPLQGLRHLRLPEGCTVLQFLNAHDDVRAREAAGHTPEEARQLQEHYGRGVRGRPYMTDAVVGGTAAMLDFDPDAVKLAFIIRTLLPGAKLTSYRDMIGMGHHMGLANDHPEDPRVALSTPMQWGPGRHAGFSPESTDVLYRPVCDDRWGNPRIVNVEAQLPDRDSMLHFNVALNRKLRRHPILSVGDFHPLELPDSRTWGGLRTWGDRAVIGIVNLDHDGHLPKVGLPRGFSRLGNAKMIDVFTGKLVGRVHRGIIRHELPPQGYLLARLVTEA